MTVDQKKKKMTVDEVCDFLEKLVKRIREQGVDATFNATERSDFVQTEDGTGPGRSYSVQLELFAEMTRKTR